MLRNLWLAAALAASGCYSIEEVRQQPVAWTATYPVPFDTMANCLAAQWIGNYRVAPAIYPRRADVTIAASSVIAEYQIVQISDVSSEVRWHHMHSTPGSLREVDRTARERADRCAVRS